MFFLYKDLTSLRISTHLRCNKVAFISGMHYSYPTPRALTNKNKLSLESALHFSKYLDLNGEKNFSW